MFNFFDEIKTKFKDVQGKIAPYECVMLGGFLLYVEGFLSLITYSPETVVFKVKGGAITVVGNNLTIKEMSPSTITISGKISKVECVWSMM